MSYYGDSLIVQPNHLIPLHLISNATFYDSVLLDDHRALECGTVVCDQGHEDSRTSCMMVIIGITDKDIFYSRKMLSDSGITTTKMQIQAFDGRRYNISYAERSPDTKKVIAEYIVNIPARAPMPPAAPSVIQNDLPATFTNQYFVNPCTINPISTGVVPMSNFSAVIVNTTTVNNNDVSKMSKDDLFNTLIQLEKSKEALENVKTKSAAITKQITQIDAALQLVATTLDAK